MSLGFVCGEYVGGVGYGRGKWQGIVMRIYYDMVAHSRERVIVDSSLLFVLLVGVKSAFCRISSVANAFCCVDDGSCDSQVSM